MKETIEYTDMTVPKNTFMRDENGNIREGVKWYVEMNDILVRFFGNECGYNRGFHTVTLGNKNYMGNVFELDIDKKPTQEFFDFIRGYQSEYIKGIAYQEKIMVHGRPFYRNAIVVLV